MNDLFCMNVLMTCGFPSLEWWNLASGKLVNLLSNKLSSAGFSHGTRVESKPKKTAGWWFGPFFIFPYIGNNHPNWLIFFRGVQTTNQTASASTSWRPCWMPCHVTMDQKDEDFQPGPTRVSSRGCHQKDLSPRFPWGYGRKISLHTTQKISPSVWFQSPSSTCHNHSMASGQQI